MKLVIAVVRTEDADSCVTALIEAGFLCTRLASFGGFLDRDNVTLLIGVDTAQVDEVLEIVRRRARGRSEALLPEPVALGQPVPPMDVEVGRATVFVIPVDRFEKL
jgi:uncharacterized protein YaaQ